MAILLLTEADVRALLTMEMALESVEEGLRGVALDEAQNAPRMRLQTDHALLHVMSASAKRFGVLGYKAYTTARQGARFHVGLFDGKTGEPTAILQADYLGQVRTGAASGVATKYLARQDSATVGCYGAGKQARTQLLAVVKVRNIKHIHVFSRTEERCRLFCQEMTTLCECPVEPASHPEEAARNKDIVITATSSRDPVLYGDWIREGTHLNIIGSNFISKAEIDLTTIRRSQVVVVDNKDQAHGEAGDFQAALNANVLKWADVGELGSVIVGRSPGRRAPSDITLFKSLGIAIEDVTTAARVVMRAKELKIGQWIDW